MPRSPKYIAVAAPQLTPAPENLHAGTSGWAYTSWKPGFYDEGVPSRAFLHFYAARMTAVEVNFTFRKALEPGQLLQWLEATPPGFHFAFKAPEAVTHRKRLRECEAEVEAFTASLKPADKAGKLGPLLFQFPPNFRRTDETQERLATLLAMHCLRRLRVACEFRHASWFDDGVFALLRRWKAALCVAESEDLETPDVQTAPFRYYRLRHPGAYDAETVRERAAQFTTQAAEASVYAFFKHEDEPHGALSAQQLLEEAARLAGAA